MVSRCLQVTARRGSEGSRRLTRPGRETTAVALEHESPPMGDGHCLGLAERSPLDEQRIDQGF